MELKKREDDATREYAKIGDISKKELKIHTPNKWLVASAIGLTTLFYSNSNSILGHIGVVFGCVEVEHEYTILGKVINFISNISFAIFVASFFGIIIIGTTLFFDLIVGIVRKKRNTEEFENSLKKIEKILRNIVIVALITLVLNLFLDNVILEMPFFWVENTSFSV